MERLLWSSLTHLTNSMLVLWISKCLSWMGLKLLNKSVIFREKYNEKIDSGVLSTRTLANVAHYHTPILAMTADVIQATSEKCMKSGMDGYVSKPFEEGQLYSAVALFFECG
ncbi:hypothetical protein ACH5RR_037075 [Cinchona calisaya]|uniref:Response regulatory domain-containing protein n=1 Tax=Cinchona calisaya TaxID=153742 RepID=A0ABD2Y525_9GENT